MSQISGDGEFLTADVFREEAEKAHKNIPSDHPSRGELVEDFAQSLLENCRQIAEIKECSLKEVIDSVKENKTFEIW